MTSSIQSVGTDPGAAARPAGLRATALRRLRRDPVAIFAFSLLVLLVLAALIGGPLAAHLTGHPPDQQFANAVAADGQPLGLMERTYLPNGTTHTGVSFAYWTAPLFDPANPTTPTDTTYNMLTADGKNVPAPWVPYTRAGCNVGTVATANMVLENTAIDIPTVFGANSPEAQEVIANPGQAFADFVGVGIHCAQGCRRRRNRRTPGPDWR